MNLYPLVQSFSPTLKYSTLYFFPFRSLFSFSKTRHSVFSFQIFKIIRQSSCISLFRHLSWRSTLISLPVNHLLSLDQTLFRISNFQNYLSPNPILFPWSVLSINSNFILVHWLYNIKNYSIRHGPVLP